jgi:hypothetical protein
MLSTKQFDDTMKDKMKEGPDTFSEKNKKHFI